AGELSCRAPCEGVNHSLRRASRISSRKAAVATVRDLCRDSLSMGENLLIAFALVLVLEGVLPFLIPTVWRETFRKLTELSDGQLRFIGLTSMLAGLLLLFLVK
ncbi:MAG: DUF2065 domain-containing protein, partial [Burkholderiales bacterium]